MSCGDCHKSALQTVADGVVGLSKAALGIGLAGPEVIARRRDVCRQCPNASRSKDAKFAPFNGLTSFSRCAACACFVSAKTRLASEQCPLGHW